MLTTASIFAADAKVMQFDRLKEDLTARKQELVRESLRRNEVLSALSQSQTQEKQLQKQLEAHTRTAGQKQSEIAMLKQKMSQQQQELALAKEQAAEAKKHIEDRQQAATAFEKQIESIKAHAAAQTASRQRVEQQLTSTQVQQQEQADTVCKLVEKLDAASSSMLAKDENIKLLNEQVLIGNMVLHVWLEHCISSSVCSCRNTTVTCVMEFQCHKCYKYVCMQIVDAVYKSLRIFA